jgi:hypothetical protein
MSSPRGEPAPPRLLVVAERRHDIRVFTSDRTAHKTSVLPPENSE